MIFIYSLALFQLGLTHLVVKRRVAALEARYLRVAREADELLRLPLHRAGNRSGYDPYQAAKRQLELGVLAQKRDRVENRYTTWQNRSERIAKLIEQVRGWKGRTLPYTFGALDVAFLLALADQLGFGRYVEPRQLIRFLIQLVAPDVRL